MDVIRRQIPVANIPSLKQKANLWFPYIEAMLQKFGIPEDFKYLPIVESGFMNQTSKAGANGFWQLMPATAKEYNLIVNSFLDERNDPKKSTYAACKLIRSYYELIKRQTSTGSWVLTAAAYNTGVGNLMNAVSSQGGNYFRMDLNAETAEYVYKLIAIKELFENPEVYMKGFGRNVFATAYPPTSLAVKPGEANKEFSKMSIEVGRTQVTAKARSYYIPAHIVPEEDEFNDGSLVAIALEGDLKVGARFIKKGNIIKGNGWLIDDRVFINMGYGHKVQVMDAFAVKGIPKEGLCDREQKIFLKVIPE